MFNDEELVCLWFDYNGYTFSKLEKILQNFDTIDSVFDKKLVKSAFFEKDLEYIRGKLLELDKDKFTKKIDDFARKNCGVTLNLNGLREVARERIEAHIGKSRKCR